MLILPEPLLASGHGFEMPTEAVAGRRPVPHLRSDRGDDIPRRHRKVDVVLIDLAVDLLQFGGEFVDLADLAEPRPGGVDLVEIGMPLESGLRPSG